MNSTGLTQFMDPEDAHELLGGIFDSFTAIVEGHEGSVEKYIGDAMVAVFGVPAIHEDDADRAVHCAQLLLRDLPQLSAKFRGSAAADQLAMRIGIHSGLITTGTRGDFDVVTGGTMNLAARIQSAAEPGEILLSSHSAELCSPEIRFGRRRVLQVKGLDAPVEVYSVIPGTRQPGESAVYLGREDLLREMLRSYFSRRDSKERGFLITGEPGVGKTEAAQQFLARLERHPEFHGAILRSRARKFRRIPYVVIVDFIANYFDLHPGLSEAQVVHALCNRDGGILIKSRPLAARFAQFYRDRSGATLREQAFEILNGVLQEMLSAVEDPSALVLFIDNSDTIDRKSQDYLRWLYREQTPGPMVILAEREPRIELDEMIPGLLHRELEPLEPLISRRLAEVLISQAGRDVQEGMIQEILRFSKGNPLYIKSYVRHLLLQQERRGGAGSWGPAADIPESIQNLFLSRIESFNPDIRELIIKLSVFVHFFSESDARTMQRETGADEQIVPQALEFYISEDLLEEDRGIYSFRHELIKKALYDSILNYNKSLLHSIIVRIMEGQNRPHPVRLLHHLVKSRQIPRAIAHLGSSQTRAYNMDFLPYLDMIQESAGDDPVTRLDVLFMKARILFNNGFVRDADAIVKEILRKSLELRQRVYSAVANHILCAYNIKSYRLDKGLFCGERALLNYRLSDAQEFSRYHGMVAGDPEAARRAVLTLMIQGESLRGNNHRAQEYLQSLADEPESAAYLNPAVHYAILRGRYRDALALIESAGDASVREELDRQYGPTLHFLRGSWEALPGICQGILSSVHRDSISMVMAHSYRALGLAAENADSPEIAQALEQSAFRALQSPNDFDGIYNHALRAELLFVLGMEDAALKASQEALLLAQRHSAGTVLFTILVLLAEHHYLRAEAEESRFFLTDALQLCWGREPLRRRDRMSCIYLSLVTGIREEIPGHGSQELLQQELEELISEELAELDPEKGRQRLVSQRVFKEILGANP